MSDSDRPSSGDRRPPDRPRPDAYQPDARRPRPAPPAGEGRGRQPRSSPGLAQQGPPPQGPPPQGPPPQGPPAQDLPPRRRPPPQRIPAGRTAAPPRQHSEPLRQQQSEPSQHVVATEADESAAPPRDSDTGIMRTSGSIAIATLVSRISGFIRTVLLLATLGPAIASAFQAAYVLPNMIAEVMLGAVLTAIVIPVLARAEAEDRDGGEGFINRIFTLTVVILGSATVIALLAAPLLTMLNVGDGEVNRPLTTTLAYLLLPQILFYGLSALFIATLNMKGHFKPGAWAPVANNIVQISTLILFWATPGDITLNPVQLSDPKLLVLGIGTSLGVVLQVAILVPWLRRSGVKLRLQWGIDNRLRQFGNMAVAIVTYVLILQVGLVITYRIAASATSSGISIYATHWQLLQLPYGVLGVTILTALMPRLARNAVANDTRAVSDDMSLATRLTVVALVPIVAFMTFFGPPIAIAVFNFGNFGAGDAAQLGSVLSWGAFTLIPYAMTLVQLRVFYAREDAWTPTLMVLGITAVKVVSSYLGPVLFDDPDLVVRWLSLSNGLGYLVGAIVGHYLLKKRLGGHGNSGPARSAPGARHNGPARSAPGARHNGPARSAPGARLPDVTRTSLITLGVSMASAATVFVIAEVSGLHRMATELGNIGALIYLALTATVVLGVTYAGLAACKLPDVVAITGAVQRLLGRVFPALAPAPSGAAASAPEDNATLTIQFPRVPSDESLPYSGQVQVVRRFDRGTATWQSYSVHTGGAVGAAHPLRPVGESNAFGPWTNRPGGQASAPPDMRYRRRGVRAVSESGTPEGSDQGAEREHLHPETAAPDRQDAPTADSPEPSGPGTTPAAPVADSTDASPGPGPQRRRGPRLVPGAAVAGGRYRLLDHHGGTRGLQFWRARDINLERDVALTFVDANQLAPPPARGEATRSSDEGPQGVLTRTLRLGHIASAGVARVLDVVRGSSGGIVVAEWTPGSSLAEVAKSHPSPIGAARAVRSLAAAAETAHRSGGALSIDHPDRVRISSDGNAVLAFPGTLAGDDKSSDVRGLGAVLYALLLSRWALDPSTGSSVVAGRQHAAIGGLDVADADANGDPVEPREADGDIPFEISAVAARALAGTRGIRTAATVQHVLDQATVVDLKTDALPIIGDDEPPVRVGGSGSEDPARANRNRNLALIGGGGLLALFLVIALVVWATGAFGGDDEGAQIDTFLNTSEQSGDAADPGGAPAPAQPGGPITPASVTVVDFSDQPADSSANVDNVISGSAPGWRTATYRGSPEFGGLKDGLGLMFDLGGDQAVRTVTVNTPTPGFEVELRSAPSASAGLDQTQVLTTGTVDDSSTTFTIDDPESSPYLLLWISTLPQAGGGYQAEIGHVTMQS